MKIGIAADHGGFALKEELAKSLRKSGHEVLDFGATRLNPGDDYPDFVVPLARAVVAKQVERGVALCGSGIGASIAATRSAACGPASFTMSSPPVKASRTTT
jgi:ribose 5-phosphate isomerase B